MGKDKFSFNSRNVVFFGITLNKMTTFYTYA